MKGDAVRYDDSTTSFYSVEPTASETSVASASEADIDELFKDVEEEPQQVVKPRVRRPRRKIILTRRTYLLLAFVIITALSILTLVLGYHQLDRHDVPPTLFSSQSCVNTLLALISLIVVTPIGFVILKFRIANLVVGFLYMLSLVSCLFFASKGIARGAKSLKQDTADTIHKYAFNRNNVKYLHTFWAYYQIEHKCCGTKDIDRVQDWPGILNTIDLPHSCCTEEYAKELHKTYPADNPDLAETRRDELSLNCGRGLGRTRTRRMEPGNKFRRVPSGFYLSLTPLQVEKLNNKFDIITNLEPYDVLYFKSTIPRDKNPVEGKVLKAFNKYWENFLRDSILRTAYIIAKAKNNGVDPSDKQHDAEIRLKEELGPPFGSDMIYPHPPLYENETISTGPIVGRFNISQREVIRKRCENGSGLLEALKSTTGLTATQYCSEFLPDRRRNANTFGRELLLMLDYLTSYLYEFGDIPTIGKKKPMVLWPVPNFHFSRFDGHNTFNLAANLYRVPPAEDPNLNTDNIEMYSKRMYYMSRGIAENYALRGVIHDKVCESMKKEFIKNIKSKLALDMAERYNPSLQWASWENPEEGLGAWFLSRVHKAVRWCIVVSSGCIICVVIIAGIFWQYYSRIKAEEYANLALPKEFEVLHFRRGSMEDKAVDIAVTRPKKIAINTVASSHSLGTVLSQVELQEDSKRGRGRRVGPSQQGMHKPLRGRGHVNRGGANGISTVRGQFY